MTPRQREEVEIKECVTGAEQTSLQNCIWVNNTRLSMIQVKNHIVGIIKHSFKIGVMCIGGEGSEMLKKA